MFRKYSIWLIATQLLIFILSLITYHSINLLTYINISFIVGFLYLLLSLTVFVVNKGFFDVVFASFQHVFSRMTDKDRRPLSKLITFRYNYLFVTGSITLIIMLCALVIYYK
ncbi:DUF3899 domain-containing protein [Heyndrickxia oleronia]|uniref:DUF3899 domain-containing protein n=1 Tax=Heyndrickxia oleronia TaxID=38875 RepID=UPI003F847690